MQAARGPLVPFQGWAEGQDSEAGPGDPVPLPLLLDLGAWALLRPPSWRSEPLARPSSVALPTALGGTPAVRISPGRWGLLVFDRVAQGGRIETRHFWIEVDPGTGSVLTVSRPFQLLHGDEERATSLALRGRYLLVGVSALGRECWVLRVRATALLGRPPAAPVVLPLLALHLGVLYYCTRARKGPSGRGRPGGILGSKPAAKV